MRHPLLPRIASFVLVLLVAATARAQVFIPDTLVRSWLNQSIPGIVDANGIMDTTHAGIAGCDSVNWQASGDAPLTIDLTGLQFLDSLKEFRGTLTFLGVGPILYDVPAWPPSLRKVALESYTGGSFLSLPEVDHEMDEISVISPWAHMTQVEFAGINDSLHRLDLQTGAISSGPSTGHIGSLSLKLISGTMDTVQFALPAWLCDEIIIAGAYSAVFFLGSDSATARSMKVQYSGDPILHLNILSLPSGLTNLWISLDEFAWDFLAPGLPSTLDTLVWGIGFGEYNCLPPLPDGLKHLMAAVPCIPNIPDSILYMGGEFIWQNPGDTILCSILNSDCPGAAAAIAGRHAIDDNSNGLVDAGEPIFPWGRVLIQPMNALVPAGADGWWERGVQPGTYTIEPNSTYPYLVSSAPAQHSATFAALGEVDSTNHFAHTLLPGVNDLQVDAYAEPPRPGFDNTLHLSYRNYGTTALPATLQLSVDTDQSFVSSSPAPTTLVGNSATWDLGTLPIGAHGQVAVTLHTDAAVPLGTPVQHTAVIDPVAGDTVPANNTTLWTDTVVGAYDPNDKLLDIPAATPAEVQADAVTLTYTIRFQNTGTYPAERVLILDTLSDDLQWNSFELLSSSHPCQWYMVDGVLHFLFDPILLPDSGSNEPASHGFVRFRMRPSTQLNNGDQVDNIAHIVFDFNTPIVTPPATFRVDVSTAVEHPAAAAFTVVPNPTRDRLLISGLTGAATVRLLDLSGRLLRTLRVNAPALLDVGDLATGTYLLELRTPEAIGSVRFVKE